MRNLLWKKEYSVGIASIDDQHKAILAVFNAFLQKSDAESYVRAYRELGRLIEEHFRHEEMIMRKHRLSGFEEHKQWHDAVLKEYRSAEHDTVDEHTIGVIRKRLYTWIASHILDDAMDRGIAIQLRRMGIYRT